MSTSEIQEAADGRGRVWDALAAVVSLVGVLDASYLTVEHLSGNSVRCMIVTGCDEVLQSSYATLPGGVPVAALGAVAYFTAFSLATLSAFGYGGPLEVIYGRGRRYIEAREGAEYELVVRNPLPVRVAVALSVDGLNTVDARRTSSWESSKWVIEPYGTARIKGWQMSSSSARRFYFTTERDSYAARMGRTSDLGVITAVFYREATPRPYPAVPPPYDPVRPRDRSEQQTEKEPSERSEDNA